MAQAVVAGHEHAHVAAERIRGAIAEHFLGGRLKARIRPPSSMITTASNVASRIASTSGDGADMPRKDTGTRPACQGWLPLPRRRGSSAGLRRQERGRRRAAWRRLRLRPRASRRFRYPAGIRDFSARKYAASAISAARCCGSTNARDPGDSGRRTAQRLARRALRGSWGCRILLTRHFRSLRGLEAAQLSLLRMYIGRVLLSRASSFSHLPEGMSDERLRTLSTACGHGRAATKNYPPPRG